MQLREVYHSFTICKVRDNPFSSLFVPLRIIDDCLELIAVHQNVDDSLILLDLFLLISDCVKKLLFFLLMLVLNVPQFDQISSIFFLNFLKTKSHLINFLVQTLIVLLNVQQLILSSFLFFSELFLFFLLNFELLLEFLYLLHFTLIITVWTLPFKILLQHF